MFSAQIWFVKISTRFVSCESHVVKSNPVSEAYGITLHGISRSVLVTSTYVNRKKLLLVHPKNTDEEKRIWKCNCNAFCITCKSNNKKN